MALFPRDFSSIPITGWVLTMSSVVLKPRGGPSLKKGVAVTAIQILVVLMTGCNVHTAEKGITNVLPENDVQRKKIIASLGFIASKQYNCTPYALFYVTGECYYFVCFEK